MLLRIFLESISSTKSLPTGKTFCFFAKKYPLLFFYHLISFFKNNSINIESLDCKGADIASVKALLSTMSFSGKTVYYLENFSMLSTKKQQELLEYLSQYNGPHQLLLFSDNTLVETLSKQSGMTMNIISLPEEIASRDLSVVRFLITETSQSVALFTSQLVMQADRLSLDSACLFVHYELLLGKNTEEFFDQWMIHLIEPTSSLFVLSQHFFAKKNRLFFRQWSRMSEGYMPPFWATFWADQLWRAYVFCDLMKQKKYAESKKAQYKLPFSFINRDWSSYSLTELRNAHHFVSTLDFQFKNGCSDIGLDHFYTQFFENKFR